MWLCVRYNRLKSQNAPIRPRRIKRNGNRSRIEAAKKPADILQARRIEQQYAFSGCTRALKFSADRPGALIQLSIGQMNLLALTVAQKRVTNPVGLVSSPPAEQFDQSRKIAISHGTVILSDALIS